MRRLLLALLGAALAVGLLAGGQASAAKRSGGPCTLRGSQLSPPGRTPAYNLHVSRSRTTCGTAVKVMQAFHRCRTTTGSTCRRRVERVWRCTGRRDHADPTTHGSFACSAPGRRRVVGGYWQERRACYGAAARDPELRCFSQARDFFPALGVTDPGTSWQCNAGVVAGACALGVPEPAPVTRTVAIIGDSHTFHWRAALRGVADAQRWRLLVLSEGGCFFNSHARDFTEGCGGWYANSQAFMRQHPEIDTVVIASNADTPLSTPPGESIKSYKTAGFSEAFKALPASVKHVVVLRDLTNSNDATYACLGAQPNPGPRRTATLCPVDRSKVLRDDYAVDGARALHDPRYQVIDLSDLVCATRSCYPIVGGVMVNGDIFGHLNVSFTRTLAPYLLRAFQRFEADW